MSFLFEIDLDTSTRSYYFFTVAER
eukprot:COSAG01_NODE_37938_length_495_cov_9.397985_1_plen_24_part_10